MFCRLESRARRAVGADQDWTKDWTRRHDDWCGVVVTTAQGSRHPASPVGTPASETHLPREQTVTRRINRRGSRRGGGPDSARSPQRAAIQDSAAWRIAIPDVPDCFGDRRHRHRSTASNIWRFSVSSVNTTVELTGITVYDDPCPFLGIAVNRLTGSGDWHLAVLRQYCSVVCLSVTVCWK